MSEILYNPTVHTRDAWRTELRLVADDPRNIVIGSVGRCAVFGKEPSLYDCSRGIARDIDVTTTNGVAPNFSRDTCEPFSVDSSLEGLINIRDTVAVVMFDVRYPDTSVEMPSSVFVPYEVLAGGVTFNTFHPDTLANIHRICGTNRPKDNASLRKFREELKKLDYPKIPEVEFEPLEELQRMVDEDRSLRRQRRLEYFSSVHNYYTPYGVRRLSRPALRSLKILFGITTRHDHLRAISLGNEIDE